MVTSIKKPNFEKTFASESQTGKAEERVFLDKSFYQKLLNLPSCKVHGICDNCGRCQR